MDRKRLLTPTLLVAAAVLLAIPASLVVWLPAALGADTGASLPVDPSVMSWGFAAAAAATGLSAIGAAYAVASVGSAGVGALAERPELMGRILVLVGLAEGIAIYGLIVSILIINAVT